MTNSTSGEPCLGPHTCPGTCGATITAREFCCEFDWCRLTFPIQHLINSTWNHVPEILTEGVRSAKAWFRRFPHSTAYHPLDELVHPCLGYCQKYISGREISCQPCWLRLPPNERKAVWGSWDAEPTQLAESLTGVKNWFQNNPHFDIKNKPHL